MNCDLCGSKLIVTYAGTQVRPAKIKPCPTCQEGAYRNGYDKGFEDKARGKKKEQK